MFGWLRTLLGGGDSAQPGLPGQPGAPHPLEVTGVVHECGAVAFDRGGKYEFSTWLVVWRQGNGPVQQSRLRLERTIRKADEAERWKALFPARGAVRVRLAKAPQSRADYLVADVAEFLSGTRDFELERLADPILNPEPYDHPRLGRFEADRSYSLMFVAPGEWLGQPVEYTLFTERGERPDRLALLLDALLADQPGWTARAREKIVADLYGTWRAGGGALDPEAWLDGMRLISVNLSEDDTIEFDFDDQGLFDGAHVMVSGTMAGFELAEAVP